MGNNFKLLKPLPYPSPQRGGKARSPSFEEGARGRL